ncbi:MAG: hypothetical protein PCFJNLEI_01953 [Verrucomicrobiae bacterium]|nr:hypothetical protein [Verrucomicrobiae bacterium]
MKHFFAVLTGWILLAGAVVSVEAQVKIKLGTLAPKDSSPHQSLKVMAEAWRKAPSGPQLIMFTDGTQGGEEDMVRRMRIGQLQAAMLTASGLSHIDGSVACLQMMPKMFRSLAELDYVSEKMRPLLERRLSEKGFVVLFWTDAGWIKFFSRRPALFPDELKRQKLFALAGDNKAIEIMRAGGYQPIPLEATDIVPGLKTGLIDAIPVPPFFALAGQIYDSAPNMLDMNWVPLVGAAVVTKKTWEQLPPATQAAMRVAAEKAGGEIRAQARKEMVDSVAAMQKRGLNVTKLTPEADAAWDALAQSTYPKVRGGVVPAELFDEVQKLLKEFRAK